MICLIEGRGMPEKIMEQIFLIRVKNLQIFQKGVGKLLFLL